ncbi:MAG TPA: hypothetical protein VHR17_06745 [Thermoanaerobaculia bacterium]|nr:hypothetical protein [Thermoanaerobaculia bacterium]
MRKSLARSATFTTRYLWCALAVFILGGLASAQPAKLGAEFQVNTYSYSGQRYPTVARDGDGDFVVLWNGPESIGAGNGVFGQRFSSAGAAVGVQFLVNTYTTGSQGRPAVAMGAAGDFVVAFMSVQDQDNYGVFARRFDANGGALGGEFQLNQYTVSAQRIPRVGRRSSGDFTAVWQSPREGGGGYGIFARRVSSAGAVQASEFQVNTYTTGTQKYPSIGMTGAGAFVVAWQSDGQEGDLGIFARRFDSSGNALATEFQVPSYITGDQAEPTVAVDADGDFVIAWHSAEDGSGAGIFARRFSSAGVALGLEFQVNTTTAGTQRFAAIAAESDGDFVVNWEDSGGLDGNIAGVFGKRFTSAGAAQGPEFQVNTYFTDDQRRPAIGMTGTGAFVVAWMSDTQDGYLFGIFGQRFAGGGATIDVDGNGVVDALTDTLLMLRYVFGFRGNTLITGAVGGGCTRCSAPDIEAYIDTLD